MYSIQNMYTCDALNYLRPQLWLQYSILFEEIICEEMTNPIWYSDEIIKIT